MLCCVRANSYELFRTNFVYKYIKNIIFRHEFMREFSANFLHEFKYKIRTNSREFARIQMNFLHKKLVMLRMACTVLMN